MGNNGFTFHNCWAVCLFLSFVFSFSLIALLWEQLSEFIVINVKINAIPFSIALQRHLVFIQAMGFNL
jgi:hypothetical protein